ncbi:MAG TPA: translation initiation factor IF-2, partial [Syntrophorhabdales bacterium]|nr:translation initiation factor IF-2 [Syntrophorhabdales bacterium]
MPRIRITTLTDKMKDEQVLSKLKSIGVRTKEKEKTGAEDAHEETKEKLSAAGEKIIEKRVASSVIRRRVQAPPPPPPEPIAEKIEEAKPAEGAPVEKPVTKRKTPSKKAAAEAAGVEPVKAEAEATPPPVAEAPGAPVREVEEKLTAEAAEPARAAEGVAKEERAKPEIETIGEEKKQEITRALEEVYKQDLEKEFKLVEEEPEEEKKRKKAERLLKKIEEEEQEATTTKKKGLLKRKVVIREEDLYAFRRRGGKALPFRKGRGGRVEARAEDETRPELRIVRRTVKIADQIQVGELAKRLSAKAQDVIRKLLSLGTMSNINQSIDYETASLVATDLGFEVERVFSMEEEFQARQTEAKESDEEKENLKPRPPVVTIMGHVDHGKTLLLDTIRNTNVAEREAGGITQHIGAYLAKVNGKEIAFLDTPGHEAFTAMRARGALVTDIVVLVVAADDGVMPQTIEAINHAKAANVPIIVAINKIDKPNANPDKVMKELAEYNLISEEWGGTTLMAKISAKKKTGIEGLLELILLQAEMLELKANPDKLAKGIIIESGLDKGHGPVGTVIIKEGTLSVHDPFVAGTIFGRVKALVDDKGKRIQKAPPATPVLVVGFSDVPQAGDPFIATTEESYARELSKFRQEQIREKEIVSGPRVTLEDLYAKMEETEKLTL